MVVNSITIPSGSILYLTVMKSFVFIALSFLGIFTTQAQWKPFRFAFLSDTHIGSPDGRAEEDLRRSVADINQMTDIAFVVVTGDITELGTDAQLVLAKDILSRLNVPWYVIPGNHDFGWSESGGVSFHRTFGYDRFSFDYNGIRFAGCASGPLIRMSDGHIPRDAVLWLDSTLRKTPASLPLVFLNHYPLDNALDNWYEAIDRLKGHNTLAVLCGHGHSNHALNFEGIPAVMGRSNLRAKAAYGGYNLVDVRSDSMIFTERTPGIGSKPSWTGIQLEDHRYTAGNFDRPSFAVNDSFPGTRPVWTYSSDGNIISTPAVVNGLVIAGNSVGKVVALALASGKKRWQFQADAAVYSSPAASGGRVVFGCGDGAVYCLEAATGHLLWKTATRAAVLGSPLISNNTVYIGGSDHSFRALGLKDGHVMWSYDSLQGPVMSTPVMYKDRIVFGAWDRYLYALDAATGRLAWKWSNGSSVLNYSPAACIPVITGDVVFVAAPDRYLSAISFKDGATLWRTKEATVRESIGLSANGRYVYGKTMNDTIVAFNASALQQPVAWKMNCGYGYEHAPSMLEEKDGVVYFGTRNGRVYAIDPSDRAIRWIHKIDNSMVNTVKPIGNRRVIASTMDGKITLLENH